MDKFKVDFSCIPSKIPFRLNLDLLCHKYEQDIVLTRSYGVEREALARMSAGVSLILNEQLGIVTYFRKHRLTRSVVDEWIMNTEDLTDEIIKEDLKVLENFFLTCKDLIRDELDRASTRRALKLFIRERCLWQREEYVEKLLQILATF
jgi:hypothetical protein